MTHVGSTSRPEDVRTQRRMIGGGDNGRRSWIQLHLHAGPTLSPNPQARARWGC